MAGAGAYNLAAVLRRGRAQWWQMFLWCPLVGQEGGKPPSNNGYSGDVWASVAEKQQPSEKLGRLLGD